MKRRALTSALAVLCLLLSSSFSDLVVSGQATTLDRLSQLLFPTRTLTYTNEDGVQEEQEVTSSLLVSIEQYYRQLSDMYGMLTKSEEYREKVRRNHEKYGALRSGEGTPEEIARKRRELEEKVYIQSLFESKELTTDPRVNEKI